MLTIMKFQFLKATRSPKTAPRRGGTVTPADDPSAAMSLWQAGTDDEARRPTPAVAMIDAWAPLTHTAPEKRAGHSGVKSTPAGNRPVGASSGSIWASLTEVEGKPIGGRKAYDGCCRKEDPAQSAAPRVQTPGTRWSQNGTGTRNPGNRMDNAPEGQDARRIISASPGRMPRPNPIAICHNGTWTPPRALEPRGSSRISAACARQAGNRPRKRPGQFPGYAKSGDATLKYKKQANP